MSFMDYIKNLNSKLTLFESKIALEMTHVLSEQIKKLTLEELDKLRNVVFQIKVTDVPSRFEDPIFSKDAEVIIVDLQFSDALSEAYLLMERRIEYVHYERYLQRDWEMEMLDSINKQIDYIKQIAISDISTFTINATLSAQKIA